MQTPTISQPSSFLRLGMISPGRLALALLSNLCVFSEASASLLAPTDLTPSVFDVKRGDADDFAKRVPPIEVPPIVHGDVVYVIVHFPSPESGGNPNGGYLEARDRVTEKKLWGVQVYITDPGNRICGNEVYIREMTLNPNDGLLLVKDERGRSYTVDSQTRQVTPLPLEKK